MRLLPLILITALTVSLTAQTSGRHFRRDDRTPVTPPASHAVDASTQATPVPLQKLRSGRPWPRYHFGRLPTNQSTPVEGPVDASHRTAPATKRGFWGPRRG